MRLVDRLENGRARKGTENGRRNRMLLHQVWTSNQNVSTTRRRRTWRVSRTANSFLCTLLLCLTLSFFLGTTQAANDYVLTVGVAGNITLAEYEEVTVGFSGDPAEIVGVSFLQCTGEKPQILKVNLSSAGASVEVQDDRPGCLRLVKPFADDATVCVFPELGYGLTTSKNLLEEVDVDPTNVVLTMSNEGNGTTTVDLAMFSTEVLPETSKLEIFDEAIPEGVIEGFTLRVVVNFGWNQLEFCQNNECVVSGYLLDYEPTLPTAFICFVESQGELLYEERFRGGNELSAEMDLPDDNPYIVTFVLSHNATTNSTSPLLAINQEIVYQALIIDGALQEYPAGSGWLNRPPAFATLVTLAIGVTCLARWMQ